jgi:hypothetical protein
MPCTFCFPFLGKRSLGYRASGDEACLCGQQTPTGVSTRASNTRLAICVRRRGKRTVGGQAGITKGSTQGTGQAMSPHVFQHWAKAHECIIDNTINATKHQERAQTVLLHEFHLCFSSPDSVVNSPESGYPARHNRQVIPGASQGCKLIWGCGSVSLLKNAVFFRKRSLGYRASKTHASHYTT